MHHRIDTILKRLRQDVARRLDPESIRAACREAGHTWRQMHPRSRRDRPLVRDPSLARQHLSGTCRSPRRRTLHRLGLLPGSRRLAAGRLPIRAPRPGQVAGPDHRGRGPLARPSHLAGRRLRVLHARHPRTARAVRPTRRQTPGCGFPVAKILALFHAGTGVLLKVMATPLRSHEMASVGGIHPDLEAERRRWSATVAFAPLLIWRC